MYAIKVGITDPRAAVLEFNDQKTMYGGKAIAEGDQVFIFASENEGGSGLVASGVVSAIDDCTRLRVLKIFEQVSQKTSIQFIDYAFSQLPFRAHVIQAYNGGEFQRQFHWHVLDKGIQCVYIRPWQPRISGKVERSHKIDDDEFYRMLEGVVIDNMD